MADAVFGEQDSVEAEREFAAGVECEVEWEGEKLPVAKVFGIE